MNVQSRSQSWRRLAVLALSLLLCLSQQAAASKVPASSEPAVSASAAQAVTETGAGPQVTCDPNNPIPGQTAKVIGDDEIFLVYRNDATNPYLRHKVINFDLSTNKLTSLKDEAWSADPDLAANTWYLSAAAGDLNGTADGKRADHVIAAFQNANGQLSAIADSTTAADNDWWCQTVGDKFHRCDPADWVDVAAGNLDMSSDQSDEVALIHRDAEGDYNLMTLDGGSDGNISTAEGSWVARYGEDHNSGRERGNTMYYSIATGDLNGDGFDNEIATAFMDSDNDLQVSVHRGDTLKELYWWDSQDIGNPTFTNVGYYAMCAPENWRSIDVATGDVDGDGKDEVIAATRNGECSSFYITLLVFDFLPEDATTHALSVDTGVPIVNTNIDPRPGESYKLPLAVSISAGDTDGDGYDEIAVGYSVRHSSESGGRITRGLVVYEYFRANTPLWQEHCPKPSNQADPLRSCLFKASNLWFDSGCAAGDFWGPPEGWHYRASVAAGDVDADGMAEIALSRMGCGTNNADVTVFDAYTGLVALDTASIDLGGEIDEATHDPTVVMGDYDGDSKWGTYANACGDKKQAVVQAVLHAPPFWPEGRGYKGCDNDWDTFASYGEHTAEEDTDEVSLEATIGGSSTIEKTFKGVTGSFNRAWERSFARSTATSTTTQQAKGTHTTPPVEVGAANGSWSSVLIIDDTQWCYDYKVPGLDESNPKGYVIVPVCVYQPDLQSKTSKSTAWWYSDAFEAGGRYLYPDSWVPVGMNLAEDAAQTLRKAKQSSTWTNGLPNGDAFRAVDGNTGGAYSSDKSVTCTNVENTPYWQVDLGGLQWIDAIQIWNRTDDPYKARTKNYYLLVTDKADFPTDSTGAYLPLSQLVAHEDVWSHYEANEAGRPTTIAVGQYGRVVRVQLDHSDALNLAEVQVYGMPGTPDQWPKAISPDPLTAAANSFTLSWRTGPSTTTAKTVARPLYLLWSDDAFYTDQGSDPDSFLTGVGGKRQEMFGSGKAKSYTVGIEIRKKREFSIGYSQKTSHATTWERGVEFGGHVLGLGQNAPLELEYYWKPYVWLQQAVPEGGGTQEFLVLDYIVLAATTITNPVQEPDLCPGAEYMAAGSGPFVVPQAPLIESPTHPDPGVWYNSNAVTFTWAKPPGDPTTLSTYDWVLDQYPDTIPIGHLLGLATTKTYDGLKDGVWYLHVRARSEEQQWGDTGHRMVRVDAKPPQVSLAVDPPSPTGNGGWYVTPVTVTVSASDANGSGVTGVEVSTDGASWQPYTAALVLTADTAGTTVYARAADAAGHVSEPVSTTVKIDRTPPDSHVAGGAGPGTWVAEVMTNPAGNDVLVLAGSIADNLSGRAGLVLDHQGMYWGADAEIGSWHPLPDPAIEVNWFYTATNQLGAGYHIFTGRGRDEAGNQEDAYEIGRVLWLPKASPDLGGSSVTASQTTARPGDEILFSLVARNAGFQEAHVAVSNTLPAGLEPDLEALPSDVDYDPATRTLTWPSRLLWPGQGERHIFLARVDAGLGATSLENRATFHAFWPNTELLPDAQRQQFEDREQTVVATASVAVDPGLPADADLTPPWAILVPSSRTQVAAPGVAGAEAPLSIVAAPDATRMYLREWTPDPITGDWTVAQNSGWIDYSRNYTWTLSAGQGVKYLGAWVADGAGNVSTLGELSLAFVNRMDGSQVLADGQRIQYRGLFAGNEVAWGSLATLSGDPDLHLWKPRNAFWPDRSANDTLPPGSSEELAGGANLEAGRYLLEVQAVGASEYELSLLMAGSQMAATSRGELAKPRPQHPLTVSDPLSAGVAGAPWAGDIYMPLIFKGN